MAAKVEKNEVRKKQGANKDKIIFYTYNILAKNYRLYPQL
jgi:hypothetical protein